MLRARSIRDIAQDPLSVTEIQLQSSGLSSVPDIVFECANLIKLDLSNNGLEDLPDLWDRLPKLRVLDLSLNYLKDLPSSLGQLAALEQLFLQGNNIYRLQEFVGNLTELRSLRLDRNPIRHLSQSIGNCQQLEELTVQNGCLRNLPESFYVLERLRYLDCRNNEFTQFPIKLGQLPSLRQLNFEGNTIIALNENPFSSRNLDRFFREKEKLGITSEDSMLSLMVMLDEDEPIEKDQLSRILDLLDSPFSFLRVKAEVVSARLLEDPFTKENFPKTIVFAGKMDLMNQSEARKRLEARSIEVRSSLPKEDAILVVGTKPGRKLELARKYKLQIATSSMVARYLDRAEGLFLKGVSEGHADMIDNLRAMLDSEKPESERLAIELMEKGGIPTDLVSEVAMRWIFARNGQAKRLKKLLIRDGQRNLINRISTQQRFRDKLHYTWLQFLTRIAHFPEFELGTLLRYAMRKRLVPNKDLFQVQGLDPRPIIERSINDGELALFDFHLGKFPLEITEFSHLNGIYLMGNELESIPSEIKELTSLQRLFLSTNHLKTLPPEISRLEQLTDLNLGSNRFRNLPLSITQLTNLRTLELWNNPLTTLPDEITRLTKLEELDLGDCPLKKMPAPIWNMPGLKVLNFYNCRLSELPQTEPNLPELEFLNLGINELHEIPDWWSKLPKLQTLILNKNPLKELPVSLREATDLRELWLDMDLNWEQAIEVLKSIPCLNRLVLTGDRPDFKFVSWLNEQLPWVLVLAS